MLEQVKGVTEPEQENRSLRNPIFYKGFSGSLFLRFHRTLSLLAAARMIVSKLIILKTSHFRFYFVKHLLYQRLFRGKR